MSKLEIRDLNREIEERLAGLRFMQSLVVVRSFKGRKCYGIGLSDPTKDLILRNFQRLLRGAMIPYGSPDVTETLVDTGGTSRAEYIHRGITPLFFFRAADTRGCRLGFGNPASPPTPARTDYQLASLVSMIVPSASTSDETNWRVIVTGSYVWTAGGTVREAGLYIVGGTTNNNFLMYHDAVSDVSVPAGGTVSVTYTTQL